jgi:tetratricopeptide (TPR) repeat protein
MNITLAPTDGGRIQVTVDGAPSHSFDPAPLILDEGRRARAFLQQPEREGAQLFAALFPPGSIARQALAELDAQPPPDHIVLATADPKAQAIPWEFLRDEQGEFLVSRHRFVRGLPPDRRRDPPEDVDLSELQILAVPASPLCYRDGTPAIQPDVVSDVEGLAEAVRASGAPFFLRAVVPPTLDELHKALAPRRPTLLHFSGHGRVSPDGPTELLFEDEAGVADPVAAERLLKRRGEHLFLVFLSTCQSAAAHQRAFSSLAYELVAAGVPYALGMQFSAADPIAPCFARFFYRYLAEGLPVEEAVRQARLALEPYPQALGIPVLCAAHAGEGARVLPKDTGKATGEAGVYLWPPEPDLAELPAASQFHGYQAEVALLGAYWRDGASVITILGEGGIGKTALAVQAARRFRWRFPGGVLGLSLDPVPEPPAFLSRLAEWVWGGVPDERWDERRLLHEAADRLRREERLLVLDGYEGVVHAAASDDDSAAGTVRRLVQRLLGGKTRLLLTSGEPGDVQGERTLRLGGLRPEAGAALFRALTPDKGWRWDPDMGVCADEDGLRELSGEVGGHPLALQFLAGACAAGRESLQDFRLHVSRRLLEARQNYPDRPQHATLAACLAASLEGLAPEPRALLPRLTLFHAPFLGGIAAAALDDEAVPDHLYALTRASLVQPLEVGAKGEEATLYRLHPVVRAFLEPEADLAELEALRPRFVAAYTYFAAAAHRRFTGPGSRLVRFFLPDLDQALEWAGGRDRAGLAFNLAGLWRDYRLLDEALRLYEEARALFGALGDQQGKSATLHEMAHIYRVRGNLDEALRLYGEALAIREVLGDQQGKGATLAMMGQLLAQRGEHREALRALLISLSILTQFQVAPEAAKVAQMIANIRQETGPARFQALWAEVAGDEPLPEWLTRP